MESILCTSHNIFLTKEQIYNLYRGDKIEVVGVSVPVWFYNRKETNEPAPEIFCKYLLKCENKNFQKNIDITKDGYEITLFKESFSNKLQNKIKKYFKIKNNEYPSVKSLLDIKDGGSEWLSFKVYESSEYINITHSIEIQRIENLINSLIK
jgi:hypothetical protein